jgi:hypothetical protein
LLLTVLVGMKSNLSIMLDFYVHYTLFKMRAKLVSGTQLYHFFLSYWFSMSLMYSSQNIRSKWCA